MLMLMLAGLFLPGGLTANAQTAEPAVTVLTPTLFSRTKAGGREASALGLFVPSGTYHVTENWRVTLEYNEFGDNGYSGTKVFSGTQTGTLVIENGSYTLVNKTGFRFSGGDSYLLDREIEGDPSAYYISGSYAFGPAYGASAKGIVFLGAFVVSVPLLDGEIPVFTGYDYFAAHGPASAVLGGGSMRGPSLTARVSTTLSLDKVVGPPRIVTQPQAQMVYAGQDARFVVVAGGDGPLGYAWRKGSALLPGETRAQLVLSNVQPGDAGNYSVVVTNRGGKVTSSSARLTVRPAPPAWVESWESTPLGTTMPSTNQARSVLGDRGHWAMVDTVSLIPDCGPVSNHVDILEENGHKLLKLVSVANDFGCAENISVEMDPRTSTSLPIPLVRSSEISFFERGALIDPHWNGLFGCIVRPCGDTVHVRVTDDRQNEVLYIFQRAPNYVEHAFTNGVSLSGYREIFLDPAGGTFTRNLFEDLAQIAGPNGPGQNIEGISFAIASPGWAELDDLRIASTAAPADEVAPSVTVVSPANNARLLDPHVTLAGTAHDDVALARVEYQLNDATYVPATGTTNWEAQLLLVPGRNVVFVRSEDSASNTSAVVQRVLTYAPSAPITIEVTGPGQVTPNLNGQILEVGKSYSFTATPAPGALFVGWSGSDLLQPKLTVQMQSNLVLHAVFVANPFIAVAGDYTGLFYESAGARQESSGLFSARVTSMGAYSAKFLGGPGRFSIAGQFALDGKATNELSFQFNGGPRTLGLELDLAGGDRIFGRLSYGTSTVVLIADRAVFNARTAPATAYAADYTLIIPGATNDPARPGGESVMALRIGANGRVSLKGTLAEGMPFKQTVPVSKSGMIPLYVPLYKGSGAILGWLRARPPGSNDLEGLVNWFKPGSLPPAPRGFVLASMAEGSIYTPIGTNRLLNAAHGSLSFSWGELDAFTNSVSFGPRGVAVNLGLNSLTFKLDPASGLFQGSVQLPNSTDQLRYKGALNTKRQIGGGFVIRPDAVGRVVLIGEQ